MAELSTFIHRLKCNQYSALSDLLTLREVSPYPFKRWIYRWHCRLFQILVMNGAAMVTEATHDTVGESTLSYDTVTAKNDESAIVDASVSKNYG